MTAGEDYDQHGEVETEDAPLADLMHGVGHVIPAPEADDPTAGDGGEDAAAGFGDEPEDEGVVEPALRENSSEEEEPGIAVAPAVEGEGEDWSGENEQRKEMLVAVELGDPFKRPAGTGDEAGE